jgi:hypothetical protein
MKQGNRIGLAAVLVCVFTPGLFADTIFIWSSGDVGLGTPFTKTVDGLEASFSSDGDPNGFEVISFLPLNPLGPVLVDNVGTFLTLTIGFSAPQTSISIPFGTTLQTSASPPPPFDLTAFNGASEVGSATATGVLAPIFPIAFGVLDFGGPAFDSVVLSSPEAAAFWIDGLVVNAGPTVPEPSSLSLVAFVGLVGFCAGAIKRLRRRGHAD